MGKKRHPHAGLYNPEANYTNYEATVRKAMQGYDAASAAGLTPEVATAISDVNKLFPERNTRKNKTQKFRARAARQAVQAAALGATYDRFAKANEHRELIRAQLERMSGGELTTAAIGAVMKDTPYEQDYLAKLADSTKSGAAVDPADVMRCAQTAAAPATADPYSFVADPCQCRDRSGLQKHAHTDIWAHGPGRGGRSTPEIEKLQRSIHTIVQRVQKNAAEVLDAVTKHTDDVKEAAAKRHQEGNMLSLGFMAQRSANNGTPRGKTVGQGSNQSVVELFMAKSQLNPEPQPEPESKRRKLDSEMAVEVARLVKAISIAHQGGNGDAVVVRPVDCVYGPKNPSPGAEPTNVRHLLDLHLQQQHSPGRPAKLVMYHGRGTPQVVGGQRTLSQPRPQSRNYHPVACTMVVDFSMPWAQATLAAAGFECVPCGRPGCGGKTFLVTARSKRYSDRIWLVHCMSGAICAVIARRSWCQGCKEHHTAEATKKKKTVSPASYHFSHVAANTIATVPPELLSDLITDPAYMNPSAGQWPGRCVSHSVEYDAISKQGFLDVERKVKASIGSLQSTISDEYEIAVLQWWSGLEASVGDETWGNLTDTDRFLRLHQRAEYEYFRTFDKKHAEIALCTKRLDARSLEAMFLEFLERFRLPLSTEYQSYVPKTDISVDITFEVANAVGEKGDGLVTATDELGFLLSASVCTDRSGETLANILTDVSTRVGYPSDNKLILNVDDKPVTVGGQPGPYEVKLCKATRAMAMVQDFFHVIKNTGTFFNKRHKKTREWATVRLRQCVRARDAERERLVDARLLQGTIRSKVTICGKEHQIIPWKYEQKRLTDRINDLRLIDASILEIEELTAERNNLANHQVDAVTIQTWKDDGTYHSHFNTSKDGNGAPVPYVWRSDEDMDVHFSAYEAEFISTMYDQTWTFISGQRVTLCATSSHPELTGLKGVVGDVNPAVVVCSGLPVVLDNGTKVTLPREALRPDDPTLVWTPRNHRNTDRSQVTAYCTPFHFRFRKSGDDDRPIIASVTEFVKQTVTMRERVAMCRPPPGVPQFLPSRNPVDDTPLVWNGLQLYRQLHHTNNAELNHRRILDIHQSNNYSPELASGLLLLGIVDKNRRNAEARGMPAAPHNHVWRDQQRKRRRTDNPAIFGEATPPDLGHVKLYTPAQTSRAAPAAAGLDQPGLPIFTRLDARVRRGAAARSDTVAAPVQTFEPRPPVRMPAAEPLDHDSVKMALDFCKDLDGLTDLIASAKRALLSSSSRQSTASARIAFARGLASVAAGHLQQYGVSTTSLSSAERAMVEATTPPDANVDADASQVQAVVQAAEPPSSASGEAPPSLPDNWVAYTTTSDNHGGGEVGQVYYYNETTAKCQWAVPRDPADEPAAGPGGSAGDTAATIGTTAGLDRHAASAPACLDAPGRPAATAADATRLLPELARADDLAAVHHAEQLAAVPVTPPSAGATGTSTRATATDGNNPTMQPTRKRGQVATKPRYPCTCGRNHTWKSPVINDEVSLHVSGWTRLVKGHVIAVGDTGKTATVLLNESEAPILAQREYTVNMSQLAFNMSVGRCLTECRRALMGTSTPTIGDRETIVRTDLTPNGKTVVGVLEYTGSGVKLGRRSNRTFDLVGWEWADIAHSTQ